jgi:hypothetical protein
VPSLTWRRGCCAGSRGRSAALPKLSGVLGALDARSRGRRRRDGLLGRRDRPWEGAKSGAECCRWGAACVGGPLAWVPSAARLGTRRSDPHDGRRAREPQAVNAGGRLAGSAGRESNVAGRGAGRDTGDDVVQQWEMAPGLLTSRRANDLILTNPPSHIARGPRHRPAGHAYLTDQPRNPMHPTAPHCEWVNGLLLCYLTVPCRTALPFCPALCPAVYQRCSPLRAAQGPDLVLIQVQQRRVGIHHRSGASMR